MGKDDDDWENEVLGGEQKKDPGITVDAARKLLEINPEMREKGIDTNFIVKQSGQAKQQAAAKSAGEGSSSFNEAKDVDHLLELAAKQYQQEKREIESELSILQSKLSGLKTRYCRSMMNRLSDLDRNLSSPLTQAALQQHRVIVSELGFTPQKFLEHLRSKR